MTPAQERAYRCQQARKHGDYQTSLQLCLASAAEFKRMGDAQKINPWYLYEVQGMMLEAAANDYAALGRHAEAQVTACRRTICCSTSTKPTRWTPTIARN